MQHYCSGERFDFLLGGTTHVLGNLGCWTSSPLMQFPTLPTLPLLSPLSFPPGQAGSLDQVSLPDASGQTHGENHKCLAYVWDTPGSSPNNTDMLCTQI